MVIESASSLVDQTGVQVSAFALPVKPSAAIAIARARPDIVRGLLVYENDTWIGRVVVTSLWSLPAFREVSLQLRGVD